VNAVTAIRLLDERAAQVVPYLDPEDRRWFMQNVAAAGAYVQHRSVADQNQLWQVEVWTGGFRCLPV
jgi:hypothetical protein